MNQLEITVRNAFIQKNIAIISCITVQNTFTEKNLGNEETKEHRRLGVHIFRYIFMVILSTHNFRRIGDTMGTSKQGGMTMIGYVGPFLLAFLLVYGLVPVIRSWALYIQFVDKPSKRKIHAVPIPLMGGLAIFMGTLLSMLIFLGLTPEVRSLIAGGGLLLMIGLIDDWYKSKGIEFPVWPRLLVQIAAALIPVGFGIKIIGVTHLFDQGMFIFPGWFSVIATVIWIIAITNMVNFIDGVDGLATGIVTISSLTLFIVAFLLQQHHSAVMAIILMGGALAFLRHNFFPAKIFMGDAGATFLGYALAVLSVAGAFKSAMAASILIPVLALGVPIMDTVYVMFRRLREKTSIVQGDRMHTHHILMRWGLNQIQTVSFLYLVGLLFSLMSIIILLTFGGS